MNKYYRTNYNSVIQQFFIIDNNGWLLSVSHGVAAHDEWSETESIYGIDLLRISPEDFEDSIDAYQNEKKRRRL